MNMLTLELYFINLDSLQFFSIVFFFHRMIHPLSRYVGLTARHHQNQLREV